MTTVAVIVLVIDAIWKSVSPFTSSGWSTLVTPHPPSSSRPSFQMPTAMPGTWYRVMPSRTRAGGRGTTGREARGRVGLGCRPHRRDAPRAEGALPHHEREVVGGVVRALL